MSDRMTGKGIIAIQGVGSAPPTAVLEFEPDDLGVNVFVTLTHKPDPTVKFEVHMGLESFAVLLAEIRASTTPAPLLAEETAETYSPLESTRPVVRTPEDTIPDALALDLSRAPGCVDIQLPTQPPILLRISGGDGHARFMAEALAVRIRGWGGRISDDFLPA